MCELSKDFPRLTCEDFYTPRKKKKIFIPKIGEGRRKRRELERAKLKQAK